MAASRGINRGTFQAESMGGLEIIEVSKNDVGILVICLQKILKDFGGCRRSLAPDACFLELLRQKKGNI